MELSYTPRDIKEIEDITKKPITEVIADYSMTSLLLFVRKGLHISEEEAGKEIEEYFGEGENDMTALYILILEKLQARGFLPRALKIDQLKAKMENLQ